jgi:hypothetical protein
MTAGCIKGYFFGWQGLQIIFCGIKLAAGFGNKETVRIYLAFVACIAVRGCASPIGTGNFNALNILWQFGFGGFPAAQVIIPKAFQGSSTVRSRLISVRRFRPLAVANALVRCGMLTLSRNLLIDRLRSLSLMLPFFS